MSRRIVWPPVKVRLRPTPESLGAWWLDDRLHWENDTGDPPGRRPEDGPWYPGQMRLIRERDRKEREARAAEERKRVLEARAAERRTMLLGEAQGGPGATSAEDGGETKGDGDDS
jgi:hypothetical protein